MGKIIKTSKSFSKKRKVKINLEKKKRQEFVFISLACVFSLIFLQFGLFGLNCAFAKGPILGLNFDGKQISTVLPANFRNKIVNEVVTKRENTKINVQADSFSEQTLPENLGIIFDKNTVATKLNKVGREGSFWKQLEIQDLAFLGLFNQKLQSTSIKSDVTLGYLNKINGSIAKTAQDASFGIKDGNLVINNDQGEVEIDNSKAFDVIAESKGTDVKINLPVTKKTAQINADDLKPVLAEAQSIVETPLALNVLNKEIPLNHEQILLFLTVQKVDGKMKIETNELKIQNYLNDLTKQINFPPQADISDGQKIISAGKDGEQLDIVSSKLKIKGTITDRMSGKTKPLPAKIILPVNKIKRGTIVQKSKVVYLTFDDGPGQATGQILDVLKKYNVHCTFFLIGQYVLNDPAMAVRIAEEGHTLGNHTFSHIDLRPLSHDQIIDQLTQAQDAISKTTGITPKVFRAPYSFYSPDVKASAISLGMQVESFTVDPGDWLLPGVNVIISKILNRVAPNSIVIMHVNQQTADALPGILDGLRSRGYTIR